MGLAIQIGLFEAADDEPEWGDELREDLERINDVLFRNGLSSHEEPDDVEELVHRAECDGFPYSFIHYLRRAYARFRADPDFRAEPLADDEDPNDDPVLHAEYEKERSHLVCHSDCEGYYVPLNFRRVLVCKDDDEIPGGAIGSSHRLLEELVEVAPALGIELVAGVLSDEEAARINHVCWEDGGLSRELISWIALYEAARLSVERGVLIMFS